MLPENSLARKPGGGQAFSPLWASVSLPVQGTGPGDVNGLFPFPKSQDFCSTVLYVSELLPWLATKRLPYEITRPDQVLEKTCIQCMMSEDMEGELEGQQDSEEDKKECLLKWLVITFSH